MSETGTKGVITQLQEGVFTITLNRPHVLNALTVQMFHELAEAIEQAAVDPAVRIVHLRGAGGNFCSGADLSVLGAISSAAEADEYLALINSFLTRLHHMPKPVVSIVQGVAVGAGLNLALHADFVIATEDAVLQEPFVHIGLTTDFGGTYLLPRLVGLAQAKRLALLGEKLSGSEAARIGLIYKAVSPDMLEAEVEKLTTTLLRLPTQALVKTKEGMTIGGEMTLEQALEWEKKTQPALIQLPEFQALVKAKLKR
jgi:2-(1,2-epoxy-1,2-dihydrophenyl)acetyl-CoA isomerase